MRNALRKLMCLVGLHDWYYLDFSTTSDIDREVASEIDPLMSDEHRPLVGVPYTLVNRECLECGRAVNEIATYKDKRMKRMRIVAERFGAEFISPGKRSVRTKPIPPPPPPKK